MKSSRGTDVLPWILVGLSAVIMGGAVSIYSSDASANDTAPTSQPAPSLMDASGGETSTVQTPGAGSALYGPAADTVETVPAPQPRPARL